MAGSQGDFKLRIATVGHKHVARRVRDQLYRTADLDNGQGDAAAPEDGDFAGADFHGVATVGCLIFRMPMVEGSRARWSDTSFSAGSSGTSGRLTTNGGEGGVS